ncbi:MAG TPA: hypothetical protein VGE66_11110, partial [Chitinophagaceae bacterium]
ESQIHGLKWGFLHNMDTTALGINKQGFINLDNVWKDRPDQSSFLLQWKPTALWWSEDGLFGLTTGPFFTRQDSAVLATGYFFTIWQRTHTAAPFKFVVDAGVQMKPGVAPSAFVSTPVAKERIAKAKAAGKAPTVVLLASTAPAEAFYKKASKESLGQAMINYTHEQSFVLVSDLGKLAPTELGTVPAFDRKHSFQRTGHKNLTVACYYEWGQLRSSDGGPEYSGYYVHVWQAHGQKPVLLAAVYQFDQSLNP